ncbi:endonuclease/exonuclease/phosphatase family metal-dependent hydrolase [Novosphingobium sp. PhB165]|nr:endonuclease/exonuclease/phosphatase family metal-dependent hydrolase [Novosphingobium sp. PhB165]
MLTYNIEGLPWPARQNRAPYLREIGKRLAAFRAQHNGPDIIVFQEVFSGAAAQAVEDTGYTDLTVGPHTSTRQAPNVQGPLPGRRNIFRGEIAQNFTSSGLVIATDYPVVLAQARPYARGSCAGFDCLSNKGALMAEIIIPGVPGRIDVFNTHMQAQRASGVSVERHAAAHERQTNELSDFASTTGDLSSPTIIAGDFNMRNSDVRFEHFSRQFPLQNVHQFCIEKPDQCEVLEHWEHADQWRRVQDKQYFSSGAVVKIRPIRAEGMFDGGPSGPVLSDHNGFRVVYELSWPVNGSQTASVSACAAPTSASLNK